MRRSWVWLAEQRQTHLLGLMRIGFAALILAHAAKRFLAYRRSGFYFGEVFHIPLLPEAWLPSESVYVGLLALQATTAILAGIGVLARPALIVASAIGLYLLCANRLDYHNNRYALFLLSLLLAFSPCDRSLAITRSKRGEPLGPAWAVRFVGIQASLIYLASGLGKLVDADWRGGQVLHVRYQRAIDYLAADGVRVPSSVQELLRSTAFAEITSKGAISIECFLAVGLWLAPTRALALWLGLLFHVGIELGARVESFGFLMLTAYLAFVVPELGEREFVYDPRAAGACRVAGFVRSFDWLRRFRQSQISFESDARPAYYAVDRDGTVHAGLRSWVLLSRALPVLYPLWAPLAAFSWLTSSVTRSTRRGKSGAG